MKSEQEIRKHIAHLTAAIKAPCTCNNPVSKLLCLQERNNLVRHVTTLQWILDEESTGTYDRFAEEVAMG